MDLGNVYGKDKKCGVKMSPNNKTVNLVYKERYLIKRWYRLN